MKLRAAGYDGRDKRDAHTGADIAHHGVEAGRVGNFFLAEAIHDQDRQWHEEECLANALIDLVS